MGRGKGGSGRGQTGYVLDRNLVPRIENYALNNDITDVEDVIEYLRHNYKEYQRKQLSAFRTMTERAIKVVQSRGVAKPELQLQAAEERYLASRGKGSGAASSQQQQDGASGSSSDDSSGDSSGSSDAELEDSQVSAGLAAASKPGLNNSLLSMYGQAAAAQSTPSQQQQQQQQQQGGHDAGIGSDGEPPAFAPPHIVAAAAAKALAEERAAKAAKAARSPANQQQTLQQTTGTAEESRPSTSGNRGPAKPAPAALQLVSTVQHQLPAQPLVQQPATGDGKRSRSAEDAGMPQDRAVVKKARRVGSGMPGGPSSSKGSSISAPRNVRYSDLGGVEEVLADIRELIQYPLQHPEVYSWLGVEPPRGVLLHGPPGCGKTALAHAIANECGVPFLRVSAPEIVSGMSGESEAKLRALFAEASEAGPAIIFIDEIDAIAPKRETAQREMERRIVAQMLTCMDDLAAGNAAASGDAAAGDAGSSSAAAVPSTSRGHVVVIGATNRPDALDPALRRAGRFDREIALGIPTEAARAAILAVLTRRLRLDGALDFKAIAKKTPGFVGADLAALAKEAAAIAVNRVFAALEAATAQELQQEQQAQQALLLNGQPLPLQLEHQPLEQQGPQEQLLGQQQLQGQQQQPQQQANGVIVAAQQRLGAGPLSPAELSTLAISMADFEAAIPKVQPSVRREGFTTKPDVTWEDVGSLEEVREELSFTITQPIAHPERFAAMGLSAATGVLLYGPPGCGKTLVAKAVANESGANFISIKGPELLNKYVGESERAVRSVFARARAAHPCVLFFDELDALAPRRGSDINQSAERVVNQLLTEMDGMDGRQGVFIVAATNRPDMIDPALLRPGRLDKVLYVPLPAPGGRASILCALARRTPLAPGVRLDAIARSSRCDGFSGADMAALLREAAVMALKESIAAAGAAADASRIKAAQAAGRAATPAAVDVPAGMDGDAVAAAGSSSAALAAVSAGAAAASAEAAAAAIAAANEAWAEPASRVLVEERHFEAALGRVMPSVSKKDQRAYDALRTRLRSSRGHIIADAGAAAAPAAGLDANATPAAAADGVADAGTDQTNRMDPDGTAKQPSDPMID